MIQLNNPPALGVSNQAVRTPGPVILPASNAHLPSQVKSNYSSSMAGISPLLAGKRRAGKFEQLLSLLPFRSSKSVVAVLRLHGPIGKTSSVRSGLNIEGLNELIEKAFAVKRLAAVCLNVNSPGGSPVQSELIARRITTLSQEKQIPVYTFIEDVAASGGYWLACAGAEIYASKSSIIGSIGVISSGFGFNHAISKLGIERRVYSQGKNKSILDPFQPANDDDIEIINRVQRQVHQYFIDYVKTCRAGKLTQSDDVLFNGEFWAGQSAVDLGLIDGIEDMYSFIQQKFGKEVNIEYVAGKQSWLKQKLGITSYTPQESADGFVEALETKIINSRFNIY